MGAPQGRSSPAWWEMSLPRAGVAPAALRRSRWRSRSSDPLRDVVFPRPSRAPRGPLARGRLFPAAVPAVTRGHCEPEHPGAARGVRGQAGARSGSGPAAGTGGFGELPGAAGTRTPPLLPSPTGTTPCASRGQGGGGQGTRRGCGHSQGTATRPSSGHGWLLGGCPEVLSPMGCSGGLRQLRDAAGAVPGPGSAPAPGAAPKGLLDAPMAMPRLRGCPVSWGGREAGLVAAVVWSSWCRGFSSNTQLRWVGGCGGGRGCRLTPGCWH